MTSWFNSVSSRARETFNQAEEGAHNAISKVKEEASAVASKAKEAAAKMDRWIETSEPSKAADDYTAANVVAAVQAQASTPPSHHPAIMPFPLPVRKPGDLLHEPKELLNKSGELLRKIPEAIPGVKEFDSLAQDHHAQVMGEIGLVTSVVSGALGPPGAVAQLGIDFVVDSVGTKEDKYAYGAGQMVGAVVTGAAGLVGVGAGIAVEGGSGGAASEVAVPLAAAGAQTVVTAGSLAVGAHILMSRGAAPVAKPASPDTPATEPEKPVATEPSKSPEPEAPVKTAQEGKPGEAKVEFNRKENRFKGSDGSVISREKAAKTAPISSQKQAGHVSGTPQYKNRIKQGDATSVWKPDVDHEALTREALAKGKPVTTDKGKVVSGKFEYDFGRPVGTSPKGANQTKVRVHVDDNGAIHGHPAG